LLSRHHRSGTSRKKSFDPLDPEARFARTLIEFDPRLAPLAQISAEHCPSTARIRRSAAERQPRANGGIELRSNDGEADRAAQQSCT
jgi:hypothetical protein